ncbi:MAG: hypothetical protein WA970_01980 [Gammaproteobacteria bacterium]
MEAVWLSDARKIPDEVMTYLRRIAVRAVEEKSYSPEVIADVLGISLWWWPHLTPCRERSHGSYRHWGLPIDNELVAG